MLGGSPAAVRYAQIVRQWSDDLAYIAPRRNPGGSRAEAVGRPRDRIAEGDAQRVLVEDDRLLGVELDGDRTVACDALFVPPRFVPNSDLLAALGCDLDKDGWPITGGEGRTSVAGVWVAGNVANARAQVITAAGEGSAAAIAINADLVDEDVRDAVRAYADARAAAELRNEPTHQQEISP